MNHETTLFCSVELIQRTFQESHGVCRETSVEKNQSEKSQILLVYSVILSHVLLVTSKLCRFKLLVFVMQMSSAPGKPPSDHWLRRYC